MESGVEGLHMQQQGAQVEVELRAALYANLKGAGILDSLKGQLRSQILNQLKRSDAALFNNNSAHANNPPNKISNSHDNNSADATLWKYGCVHEVVSQIPPCITHCNEHKYYVRRVADSLFAEYIRAVPYPYTQTVFLPECGLNTTTTSTTSKPLERGEILHCLRVVASSPLSTHLERVRGSDTTVQHNNNKSSPCLLLELLAALASANEAVAPPRVENSVQTDDVKHGVAWALRQVEESMHAHGVSSTTTPLIEERMLRYRKEVEDRAREELSSHLERVRRFECGAVRMDEAARYRRQLDAAREQLEAVHADRLAALRSKEEAATLSLRRRQRDVEALAYEFRQKALAENEALRVRVEEGKEKCELRERAVRVEEERVKEREERVKERENEVAKLREHVLEQARETVSIRRQDLDNEYKQLKRLLESDRAQLDSE
eukprot:jgi/Chlat1/2628/Chrsp178S02469